MQHDGDAHPDQLGDDRHTDLELEDQGPVDGPVDLQPDDNRHTEQVSRAL